MKTFHNIAKYLKYKYRNISDISKRKESIASNTEDLLTRFLNIHHP